MIDNTPPQDATPGEGSVRDDCTFTLTAAELKAVRTAAFAYAQSDDDAECAEIASALLGLAERLK